MNGKTLIHKNTMPVIAERCENGESCDVIASDYGITGRHVRRITGDVKRSIERSQKRKDAAEKGAALVADPITDPIWTGDFREKMDGIPDGSIGMIFVDPPYDKGSLDLYRDLAVHAKRVLREGGSLVTYNGQYALPDTLNMMTPELTYNWQLAIKHGGQATRMRCLGLNQA